MVARERLRLKRRRRILPNQMAAKRHELNPNTIIFFCLNVVLTGGKSHRRPDVAGGEISSYWRAVDDGQRRVAGDDGSQSVTASGDGDDYGGYAVFVSSHQCDSVLSK